MITDKVKALFAFIDFLDKNKSEYIAKFIPLTIECLELGKQRSSLKPETNYKDKQQYDLIQTKIKDKFNLVYNNVTLPIERELKNLGIWGGENYYTSIYNNNISAILELTNNFKDEDIEDVIKYKHKYLSFRAEANSSFLSLELMFDELDEVLKLLFDFFKDTDKNEFETIETKTIQANDIREAAELFAKGYTKISLPNTFLNPNAVQPLPKNIPNVDTRFWLTTFFDEHEQDTQQYKNFQFKIKNDGCIDMITDNGTVKIYTPELALIFTLKELPARNMDTDKEIKLSGLEYLKTYIESYKEGEQYFEKEFKVSPDTLYNTNAEQYVRDIHFNFFHVQHTGIKEGWGFVKKEYPFILTHKVIREFGYYSGIVNRVEEQVKKYPRLFATFDKCEHNLPDQQTDTVSEKAASHREIIIAHSFKYKAGLEDDKTAAQWKTERGEKARQSFYTTLTQSENYKAPTLNELTKVIELLTNFPAAQKMAINKKAEIENL